MNTRLRILIFLSMQTLFGRISVENIENAFSEIIKDAKLKKETEYAEKIETLKNSIVNPIFGYIFESVGGLDNIRFYGPGLNSTEENEIRDFSNDESNDFITNLIINLFPSPKGILCHISETGDNFGYQFKLDKQIGIQFLADVFIKTLVQDHTIASKSSYFNSRKNIFEYQKVDNEKSENLFDPSIMRMIIHSFVINALDSSDELKVYLKHILSEIKADNIDKYGINFDITKEVYEIEMQMKEFPYNTFNYPAQTHICPIYNRETNTFDEKSIFSDSTDVVLLQICNCMFYNSENKRYSIGSLEKNSDLAQFYTKNNELFTNTDEIRKEWSKVISHLKISNITAKSSYAINSILYVNDKGNEIESGTINMMNVLIKICNIDHSKFWGKFDQKPDICKKLKDLFAELSKISGNHVRVAFDKRVFKEFKTEGKRDFMVKFYLNFKNKCEMVVNHLDTYTKMSLNFFSEIQILTNPKINELLDASELPLKILARYFSIANGNFVYNQPQEKNMKNNTKFNYSFPDDTENVFNNLYFSQKIQTNLQKNDALSNIFGIICKIELDQQSGDKPLDTNKLNTLSSITSAIIRTVPLTKKETRNFFSPYLLYTNYIKYDDILLNSWIDSLKISKIDICKLYQSKILKSRIAEIHLYVKNSSNERTQYIFSFLSKMTNLKKLKLKLPFITNEKELNYLTEALTKFTNINEIDLFFNSGVNFNIITRVFTALKELGKLTRLKITNLYFRDAYCYKNPFDGLSNLTNLEYLNMSSNHLGKKQLSSNSPNVTHETEEQTNLHLCNYLFDTLKSLKKLKELDLSYNYINSELAKDLALALKELKELTTLDISKNYIGKEGTISIMKTLSELPNLQITGITNN